MTSGVRLLAVGETAISVEFGAAIDPVVNAHVHALDHAVARAGLPGVIETVPSYRALLVLFDPLVTDAAVVGERLSALAAALPPGDDGEGRLWTVPVRFGGADGEDLDDVAARLNLSPAALIERHCSTEYRVYMIGFSPGFAYLGGLDPALALPRRTDPRAVTPAGSIMQGGEQVAISPMAMPSGWHLLGRTELPLFDPARDPPALIGPGDRVRFTPLLRGRS